MKIETAIKSLESQVPFYVWKYSRALTSYLYLADYLITVLTIIRGLTFFFYLTIEYCKATTTYSFQLLRSTKASDGRQAGSEEEEKGE